jgi:hypothetical protein
MHFVSLSSIWYPEIAKTNQCVNLNPRDQEEYYIDFNLESLIFTDQYNYYRYVLTHLLL